MDTSTINISFRKDLLSKIDRIAKEESRSRSELIREAARMYIENKHKWGKIFSYAEKQAKNLKLTENDIFEEIKGFRKQQIRRVNIV